jgi:hypothetical protein
MILASSGDGTATGAVAGTGVTLTPGSAIAATKSRLRSIYRHSGEDAAVNIGGGTQVLSLFTRQFETSCTRD